MIRFQTLLFLVTVVSTPANAQRMEAISQLEMCLDSAAEAVVRGSACANVIHVEGIVESERISALLAYSEIQTLEEDFLGALESLADALLSDPDAKEVHEAKRRLISHSWVVSSGDYDRVVSFATGGLELFPNDTGLLFLRAKALLEQGEAHPALQDIELAMASDMVPHFFRLKRARLFFSTGDLALALADLDMLSRESRSGEALEMQLRRFVADTSGYEQELAQIWLDYVPAFHIEVVKLRIETLSLLGELEKARDAAQYLQELNADLGFYFHAVQGQILERSTLLTEALSAYDQAIELAANEDDYFITSIVVDRAWLKISLGQYESAMGDFDVYFGNSTDEIVQVIQTYLKSKSFYGGEIHGVYDEETREALLNCVKNGVCQR